MLMTTDTAHKQKVSNTKGKAIGLYIDIYIYMYIDIYCVYRVNKLNAIFIKALTIKIQFVCRQVQT